MGDKIIDLTKVLGPAHEKKWVALSTDYKHVVAYKERLMELKEVVGKREVVYMKVPQGDRYYAL